MSVFFDLHSFSPAQNFRSKKFESTSSLRHSSLVLFYGMCPDADANAGVPFARKVLTQLVTTVAKRNGVSIIKKVAEARSKHPEMCRRDLAHMLIKHRALYSGVSGGAASLGGVVSIPLSLASSLAFQAEILLTVAHIYGHDIYDEDRALDLLVVMAGSSVNEALKTLGIAAGTRLTRKMVDRLFTRKVMYTIWKVVGKKMLTKDGKKSTFSLMRMVPLVAAPIGFAFDYTAARTLGMAAVMFYGGEDVMDLEGKENAPGAKGFYDDSDHPIPGATPAATP